VGNSQLARHQVHGHGITQPQVGPGSPGPRSGYVRRSRMRKLQNFRGARAMARLFVRTPKRRAEHATKTLKRMRGAREREEQTWSTRTICSATLSARRPMSARTRQCKLIARTDRPGRGMLDAKLPCGVARPVHLCQSRTNRSLAAAKVFLIPAFSFQGYDSVPVMLLAKRRPKFPTALREPLAKPLLRQDR
jgi:hypothetical protein